MGRWSRNLDDAGRAIIDDALQMLLVQADLVVDEETDAEAGGAGQNAVHRGAGEIEACDAVAQHGSRGGRIRYPDPALKRRWCGSGSPNRQP
jgi:hypothetical protein